MTEIDELNKSISKGLSLASSGKGREAIALYDEIVERYGTAREPEIRDGIAIALFNRAVALADRGDLDEAEAAYLALAERFRDDTSVKTRAEVARALSNRGLLLGRQGRKNEAINSFEDAISISAGSRDDRLRVQWAIAMANAISFLWDDRRSSEAMPMCRAVINEIGSDPNEAFDQPLSAVLFTQGRILHELNVYDQEIVAYEKVLDRNRGSPNEQCLRNVLDALFNRALCFEKMDWPELALNAYDEWLDEAGHASFDVEEQHAKVLMGKAIEQVKLGQVDRAANTLDVLIRDCGRNTQPVVREIVNSAARMSNVLEDHRGGPQE